jgi:hypothetical protein
VKVSVPDYFALLEQPRRPWLDPATLKEAFLSKSKRVDPDQAAALNAAYQCLTAPQLRLRHLFELETGKRPEAVQDVPPDLTGVFMRVTQTVRDVDAFLREWSAVTGLLKAQRFGDAQQWVETLQSVQGEINRQLGELDRRLAQLGDAHDPDKSGLLELYQLFSYYTRWSSQIQERLTRLAV